MAEEDEPAPRIIAASCADGVVRIGLDNGVEISLPVALVPGLAAADETDRAAVQVAGEGTVLHWPGRELYLSYMGLLTDGLGARAHMVRLAGAAARRRDPDGAGPPRRRPRR